MMMVPSTISDSSNYQKTIGDVLGDALQDLSLASLTVNGMQLDSRLIQAGDAFVALKGGLYDGKSFIPEALRRGAIAVLVDEDEFDQIEHDSINSLISIKYLNEKLSQFAANLFDHPSSKLSIIGITGTNGKTSCAQFLSQAIALLIGRCGVIGTTGYGQFLRTSEENIDKVLSVTGMTTPDPITVQKILAALAANHLDYCAMEVSSHGLDQCRVAAVAINTAVFTNLSHDHLDYHATMAAYGEAKAKLFKMSSVKNAVINVDDDYSPVLINGLSRRVKLITFGIQQKALSQRAYAHFYIENIERQSSQMIQAVLSLTESGQHRRYCFTTSLIGQFNLSNLLAVVAALYAEGFELEKIMRIVDQIKSVDGRMERILNDTDLQVIVDFAHTPDALEKALQSLNSDITNDLWCVFGCGGDRDQSKRSEMAQVAESLADHIVITSDNPRTEDPEAILDDIERGFRYKSAHRIVDRAEAIAYAIASAKKNDVILIAGKGHEDYQIIGRERRIFSDQIQAKKALKKRAKGQASD